MDPLARALRCSWALGEATADEVARFAGGTILRSPSMPEAWSANAIRFEDPDPGLTLDAAEHLAAQHVATPYRHLAVEDEATALRLLADAEAAGGWKTEVELVMLLERVPDAPAAAVREGTLAEMRVLMERWLTEEGQTDAAITSLLHRIEREHATWPEALLVADHEGEVAAMATIRYDRAGAGAVANVEDVYAIPASRGTGLGRAVTAAAARHAAARDAEVVFVCADDRDWPKTLYASLGFAPAARRVQLHREPDAAAPSPPAGVPAP